MVNWQFSPTVQSTQLILRCWDDRSAKKTANYPVKRLLSPSRMNTIFTNLERQNQMLVLPVGVNSTKIHPLLMDQYESRSDHRERMWSTLRQLLSVLEQRTKRGEEKEQMISFHHSVFLYTGLGRFLLPVPHRFGRQKLLSDVCSGSRSDNCRTALRKHC